jgi:signal peptidase I
MIHIDLEILRGIIQESLALGHHPRLTVSSNSMAPLIRQGDQVILAAVQPEQLAPGDIITLVDGSQFLTHRIWAIDRSSANPSILTRGDRSLAFDKRHELQAIVGQVIGRTRGQRTLSFQEGAGGWLHAHLGRVARWEYERLTGSQEAPNTGIEPVAQNGRIKLFRRLVYGWALLLTKITALAARKNSIFKPDRFPKPVRSENKKP